MTLAVHLLGRPRLEGTSGQSYQFRSRKSWALLTYLQLAERPPSRAHLASLLFAGADDPARALRWCLVEVRRGLGEGALVDGDPVVLRLPPDAVVDVDVLLRGCWPEAAALPGLGSELLEGTAPRDAAGFENWLLAEQHHLAAVSEAVLHEAALGSMSNGALGDAVGYAVRAAAMNPLDENHQALLIRLYRMSGDDDAANRQFAMASDNFRRSLGVAPGAALTAAIAEPTRLAADDGQADDATTAAVLEAGAAAIAAGALVTGLESLRCATRLADRGGNAELRVRSRLALAGALVHSLRGLDEDGIASLYEADRIAADHGLVQASAQARAELGYVDFLRGRYDRAELWLRRSLRLADDSPALVAQATGYLGSVESDRGNAGWATTLLRQSVAAARVAGQPRQAAYATSMLGRAALLAGDLDAAADLLERAVALASDHHWLAFLPWPQSLLGEVLLARGDVDAATAVLQQAFARACLLGDPCWEGVSARGLALVAAAAGETDQAFALLQDAGRRANRLADPYVWLDAYILDAQCELGLRHGHPTTGSWVAALAELTARTGMRGLFARSTEHAAALGTASRLLDLATPREPDTLGRASPVPAGSRSPVV